MSFEIDAVYRENLCKIATCLCIYVICIETLGNAVCRLR